MTEFKKRKSTFEALQQLLHQEQSSQKVVCFLDGLPEETACGQPVDAEARHSIACWCFKIMEACGYQRETARIAMSYLDRYVSSPTGSTALLDRKEFKLLSLACVYTAIKVNERHSLASHLVAKLSNGERTGGDIEKMEMRLLQGLQWRMHLPTASDFVHSHFENVPLGMVDEKTRQTILELTEYQLDASVLCYNFCPINRSTLAIAALLNAVETITEDGRVLCHFESLVLTLRDEQRDAVGIIREDLYDAISSDESRPAAPCSKSIRKPPSSGNSVNIRQSSFYSSPRTVQVH